MAWKFEQLVKVCADDRFYVVYETVDDNDADVFEIYEDDGHGNGTMIASGTDLNRICSMVLRLGQLTEYRAGVPINR